MADSITDGTHQMTPPVINATRTTNHKNDFADTIIYQVFATLNGVSTQIFETDNKDKAQQFVDVINGNTFLTKLQATIKTKYVNHAVIEDGYYTYSHIYENGQTINFTIYNSPITYNTADVINGWMGYILKFTSQVSHWWYDNHAYAYSADGTDGFTTDYPNLNLLDGTRDFSGDWHPTFWEFDGTYKGLKVKKVTGAWNGLYKDFTAPKDGVYTFSAYIKNSGSNLSDASVHRFVQKNNANVPSLIKHIGKNFDWLRDSVSISLKAGDVTHVSFSLDNGSNSVYWTAGHKWEEGAIDTQYMPSASEVQPSDYPQFKFIGTQHTPIGYLHDDPKWYDWQPFTGTLPVPNAHTEFSFSTKIWDTIEEIKAIAPINKRNIRNDNWKYAPNEQYPFIGGYES